MGRDLNPKCKQCRRAGEKLFLKGERCYTAKCAMVKRNYPPGLHGPKRKAKPTEYGIQLNEKQKAKRQYNLLEKQFRLTFDRAKRETGNTGENFLKLLEQRFDNVIYRLGWASSRKAARQLVNHGHFVINDRKVDIPSYQVRTGEVIKIKSNKKDAKPFRDLKEKLQKVEAPGWINVDKNELSAKILHAPDTSAMKPNFNMQMIVEYYSR
jgi:small subunit ribosomal protein S4